ncbi:MULTISPECIES: hypothetical protein [unclassified Bradyrhizobium]
MRKGLHHHPAEARDVVAWQVRHATDRSRHGRESRALEQNRIYRWVGSEETGDAGRDIRLNIGSFGIYWRTLHFVLVQFTSFYAANH